MTPPWGWAGTVTIFGQGYGTEADRIEEVDITFALQAAAAGRVAVREDTGATLAMVPVAYQAAPPALAATTNAAGRFEITFDADWPGVWRITATGRESGVSSSTLLTVASRQLPVTGGSSLGTQIGIGAGLLALGMVLIMLTVVRRRRNGLRAGAA